MESSVQLTTLMDFAYRPHYRAADGVPGSSGNKFGRSGQDLAIKVPVGTVVYREGELIADLKEPGQKIRIAAGGRGGRGNSSFKSKTYTAPRLAEKGEPGESVTLDLELRLIADVGLVGFPNAGKSTLLSRISAARPKIADYPFTTLAPNLGVVNYGGRTFVVADIPGLIEGAHEGRGIGDEFLRHIQRTRVLIHVVDLFGFDEKTAYRNYTSINSELAKYSKKMLDKPMLVAANKTDVTGAQQKLSELKRHLKRKKIFPISAVSGEGVSALLAAVAKTLATTAPTEDFIPEPVKKYVYEPEFYIEKQGDVFEVKGKKVLTLAAMTDFSQEEALRRFQNILKKMGVDKALEDQGVQEGDTVRIGDFEFVFEK
jgi:GTP-binding protein